MVKIRKTKIRKTGKNDRYGDVKPKSVRICHKCGSLDVYIVQDFRGKAPPSYECRTCEHVDISFPEVDTKDIEHFRKNLGNVPVERRHPVRRHEYRVSPNKGYMVGIGSLLAIIGMSMIIIDLMNSIDRWTVMLALLFIVTGVAMIITGIKAKKRWVNLNP